MTATLTLDKRGRLLMPKAAREKLHLREGSKLWLKVVGDKLKLTPVTPVVK